MGKVCSICGRGQDDFERVHSLNDAVETMSSRGANFRPSTSSAAPRKGSNRGGRNYNMNQMNLHRPPPANPFLNPASLEIGRMKLRSTTLAAPPTGPPQRKPSTKSQDSRKPSAEPPLDATHSWSPFGGFFLERNASISTAQAPADIISDSTPTNPMFVGKSANQNMKPVTADESAKENTNWEISEGEVLTKTLHGHTDTVYSVSVMPDSNCVLTGSIDESAKIWDAHTGRELHNLRRHTGSVRSVVPFSNGLYVVTGSEDSSAKIWHAMSARVLRTLGAGMTGHVKDISAVAVLPDGDLVLTASQDETIRVWNAHSGECLRILTGHEDGVTSVAAFPPYLGNRAISGSWDKTAKIWDVDTGEEVRTLRGHGASITSVAVFHAGTRVATGSWDMTAKIWQVSTGDCLMTLKGHKKPVRSVAIFPDGGYIITGSEDKTAKIWDVETGKVVKTLSGHSLPVNSVAVFPSGDMVITGSDDATAKIWVVFLDDQEDEAESSSLSFDMRLSLDGKAKYDFSGSKKALLAKIKVLGAMKTKV